LAGPIKEDRLTISDLAKVQKKAWLDNS